jgi:hypothetical protein
MRRFLLSPKVLALLSGVLALVIVVVIAWDALARSMGIRVNESVVAMALGALVTGTLMFLLGAIAVFQGGVTWMVGGSAEHSTGRLLDKLGVNWSTTHNLVFKVEVPPDIMEFDIDHVSVGPYGVLVVDSKYSSEPVILDAPRLSRQIQRDIYQVRMNARRITFLLGDDAPYANVIPVLIYWGPRVAIPTHPVIRKGEIRLVAGDDFKRWSPLLSSRRISLQAQLQAAGLIHNYEVDRAFFEKSSVE